MRFYCWQLTNVSKQSSYLRLYHCQGEHVPKQNLQLLFRPGRCKDLPEQNPSVKSNNYRVDCVFERSCSAPDGLDPSEEWPTQLQGGAVQCVATLGHVAHSKPQWFKQTRTLHLSCWTS